MLWMFATGRRIIARYDMADANPLLANRSLATNRLLQRLLGHPFQRDAIHRPGAPAVTTGALATGSARLARRLLDGRRTLAGARVALSLPPGPAFVTGLFAIWRAGGVAVPLASAHPPPETTHVLRTAAPDATIVPRDAAGTAAESAYAALMGSRIEIPLDPTELFGGARADGEESTAALAVEGADDGAVLMLFTSGTTGKPKGVRLSAAGIAATLDALAEAWRWRPDDRLHHVLPLHHTHGLIVALLGALWVGASAELTAFDATATWEALARASVFMAVPTIYVRLIDTFRDATPAEQARWAGHARGLRLFTSGSAALPTTVLAAFAEATGQTILERYGMTEIGMALSNPYDGPRVAGSVGLPLPGVQVDIVGDRGQPASHGEAGELRVRSPQLFAGYHGDPAATAASFDEEGRFRTGDTGVRGADGFVRLLGRTSVDILKSGGYKLSALEIEDVLRDHPAISDVAVIGVPDPLWGDCVTACVVMREGAALTLDELRAFARGVLAPYKLPRAMRVLPALPRNAMGKVQKSLLK